MAKPEKERKDEANQPEFDAVLPSESDNPEEVFEQIDSYQKKIEDEWNQAKKIYQDKIDQIMDDFMKRTEEQTVSHPKPAEPEKKAPKMDPDSRFEELLDKAKKALDRGVKPVEHLPILDRSSERIINAAWKPVRKGLFASLLRFWPAVVIGLLCFAALFAYFYVPPVTALPYSHAYGLHLAGNKIYVTDWFRQALYVHERRRGLPIASVEAFPNKFVSGFTMFPNGFLSVNGMTAEFYEHAPTEDHRIVRTREPAAANPGGLYYDGEHLWMADNGGKVVYKIHGGDLTEVLDEFNFEKGMISGMMMFGGRLWALNGETREINVYRLQNPLRSLAVFDLDPFLNGGKPTGISVEKKHVWITTESPAQILKISRRKLMSSGSPSF